MTCRRPDGSGWNFSDRKHQREALKMINELKPYLIIGSPPCTAWSNLQNMMKHLPGYAVKLEAAKEKSRVHLAFCVKIYRTQMSEGRYFLHEHPLGAGSWKEENISELMRDDRVVRVRTDMCAFGMKSSDEQGEGPVLKPTGFMTNSMEVAKALDKRCPGCPRHVHLMSGRAAACQVYPKGLCRAVCKGVIQQARHDAADLVCLKCEAASGEQVNNVETEPEDWRKYWDDMSGQELDSKLTQAARAEEVREIHRMGVYEKVSVEDVQLKNVSGRQAACPLARGGRTPTRVISGTPK